MATKELGFTEVQFWRMTLRKLLLLWTRHLEIKYPKQTEKDQVNNDNERMAVDEMSFWNL